MFSIRRILAYSALLMPLVSPLVGASPILTNSVALANNIGAAAISSTDSATPSVTVGDVAAPGTTSHALDEDDEHPLAKRKIYEGDEESPEMGTGMADWTFEERDVFLGAFVLSFDEDMRRNNNTPFHFDKVGWNSFLMRPSLQPLFAKRSDETLIEWVLRKDSTGKNFDTVLTYAECILHRDHAIVLEGKHPCPKFIPE